MNKPLSKIEWIKRCKIWHNSGKTETYNDAAFYPHVDLFIQPHLDPRTLGERKELAIRTITHLNKKQTFVDSSTYILQIPENKVLKNTVKETNVKKKTRTWIWLNVKNIKGPEGGKKVIYADHHIIYLSLVAMVIEFRCHDINSHLPSIDVFSDLSNLVRRIHHCFHILKPYFPGNFTFQPHHTFLPNTFYQPPLIFSVIFHL